MNVNVNVERKTQGRDTPVLGHEYDLFWFVVSYALVWPGLVWTEVYVLFF